MAYKVSVADVTVEISGEELERVLAQECKTRGITNDAQWSARMDALWDVANPAATAMSQQQRAFIAAFFKRLIRVTP